MVVGRRVEGVGVVLRRWLRGAGRVVVVGVGNELRGDDFVGVVVVRGLRGQIDEGRVLLLECETVPESFLERIVEFGPSHVLVVDAGLVGLEVGEVLFGEACDLLGGSHVVSTHVLPLRVFCEYLVRVVGCRVGLLVVEPGRTGFGVGLSGEVRETVEGLVGVLVGVLGGVGKG